LESNWRYNVAEMGMVNSTWEFGARLLPFTPGNETVLVRTTDSDRMSLWTTHPDDPPQFEQFILEAGDRFPGPFDVEPD